VLEQWIADWQYETPLARGGLCLECRSVLAVGEACHPEANEPWDDGKTVLALVDVAVMEARVPALPTERRTLWPGASMTVLGAAGTALALAGGVPTLAFLGATMAGAGGLSMRNWARGLRLRRAKAKAPIGLAMPPNAGLNERLPRAEGQITFRPGSAAGQEVASERVIRPVWAVDNGIVIARLGISRGFTVTLDDGRIVAIPTGRVRLVDRGGRTQRVAVELPHPDVVARLDRIVARVGDRVVLQAELEPSADDAASYRGAPEFTHVVVGATPVVHVGRRK